MIIIISSIIKSDNNHIWDEPKEYFKHHQCIRHKEGGILQSRQNADLNLLSQAKFLFHLRGKTTEKKHDVCPFCVVLEGALV